MRCLLTSVLVLLYVDAALADVPPDREPVLQLTVATIAKLDPQTEIVTLEVVKLVPEQRTYTVTSKRNIDGQLVDVTEQRTATDYRPVLEQIELNAKGTLMMMGNGKPLVGPARWEALKPGKTVVTGMGDRLGAGWLENLKPEAIVILILTGDSRGGAAGKPPPAPRPPVKKPG